MNTRVPILLYHSIAETAAPPFRRWVVRPRTFAAQMAYLHSCGYTPITVTHLARAIADRTGCLPERPVVITFDDGLADFYTHALPVLTEHGFAATLYAAVGFIGGTSRWLAPEGEGARPMLTWGQLAEVVASGVECGAHSLSHPQLDILSPAAARDEISRSRWLLEQRLGQPVDTFAYPHGYYSAATRRFVQESGYASACAVKHAMSAPSDDRFALARLIVTDATTTNERIVEDFAQLLSGRGLRVAPTRERARTRVWRVVRRSTALQERHLCLETNAADGIGQRDKAAGEDAVQRGAETSAPRPPTMSGEEVVQPPSTVHSAAPTRQGRYGNMFPESPPPLLVHNLLNDIQTLAQLLQGELRRGSWLNAYLLAAGMNQIVEDYLHPDPYFLGKAASYLVRLPPPLGSVAAGTARAVAASLAAVRGLSPSARHLMRRQAELATLVQRLAGKVACPAEDALSDGEALVASLRIWPTRLRHEVIRLPSCFRSFDQQPADLDRMAHDFACRWPDRRRPLVVVGIRASGNYLAPLCAAFLKAHGYQQVETLTIRPGRRLIPSEAALLRAAHRQGGLVVLTDDPPASGETIAKAARDLERAGIAAEALVLLLQLFSDRTTLPGGLRRYATVLLPWEEWSIHEQLASPAITSALAGMLAPDVVVHAVERLPLPSQPSARPHARALYRAQLMEGSNGRRWEQRFLVQGTGLGYFGEHALAIEQSLRRFLPAVYGVHGGLLYRAWVPEERAVCSIEPGAEDTLAAALVEYIVARQRALAVDEDVSIRMSMSGQLPAWEVASNLMSQAFRRGWLLVRIPILDPIVKRMLRCPLPSVIDGSMTPAHCFIEGNDSMAAAAHQRTGQRPDRLHGPAEVGMRLVKIDFAESAFTHRDLACYDPVFDLAGLAASFDLTGRPAGETDTVLPQRLRDAYERQSGEAIGDERWLLYQLVHFWDRQRSQRGDRAELRRARARAVQRYFGDILFKDMPSPAAGDLCAIDIDGVLETGILGFPSMTLASALALRALMLHGYRPVLVTGRSLEEVRERCATYHLAGGVAEYGAIVYNHGTGRVRPVLSESDRRILARVRGALAEIPGVCLDADFQGAVRAFRLDAASHRRCLRPEDISLALAQSATERQLRVIAGEAQTDFMVIGIDKGVGLRVLAADLGVSSPWKDGKVAALAVGDTISDLPMLSLAAMRFAPGNADRAVRAAGVPVLRHSYQRGLALAAGRLLDHAPGSCPTCRAPHLSPEARLLLMILGAQEAGTRGMVRQAFLLATRVWAATLIGDRRADHRARDLVNRLIGFKDG